MKKIVGIIGGKGKIGKQFGRIFKKLGFTVLISDIGTKLSNADVIKLSDIVIFSVPLHLSEKIILKEIGRCVRKDQIIMDLSSLKSRQVKAMNKAKGDVVGLHTLFGPSYKKFNNLTVIVCPGRCKKSSLNFIKSILRKVGFKIVVMTPDEHDKTMALMQVIPHLKAILSGELIKFLKIKPSKLYDIGSPIYKVELSVIGRIFSQNGELYGAIISGNPYSKKIIEYLSVLSKEYAELIARNDVKGLTKRFDSVRGFLGNFAEKGFEESEKIIRNL